MDRMIEAHLQAKAKWEIAYQRMSFELASPDGGSWDEVPRDLKAALRLARAALDEIEAAYSLDER